MFNKRKKQAEKQARLEERASVEASFATQMAAIAKVDDPAEKILQLASLEEAMNSRQAFAIDQANGSNSGAAYVAGAATGIALLIGGGGVVAFAAAPVVMLAGFGVASLSPAALYSGDIIDKVRNKKLKKTRIAELQSHLEKISGLIGQVTEMRENLIAGQAEKIAQSPLYEKVLRLPGLSERFEGVAAKQLEKAKAVAEKPAPQQPRRVPQVRDYKQFNNVFGGK